MTNYTSAEAAAIVNMAASARLTFAETAKLFAEGRRIDPVGCRPTTRSNPLSRDGTPPRGNAATASR